MGEKARRDQRGAGVSVCSDIMAKKDKILALATGFRGRAKNVLRVARNRVEKALQYQYRDRRNKKRDMRSLWIQRVNAASREHDMTYSQLVHGLKEADVGLNRKMLQELAMYEPLSFQQVAQLAREAHLAKADSPGVITVSKD